MSMADGLQGRKVFKVFNQDFIVDERYTVTKELGQGAYGIVWYVFIQCCRLHRCLPASDFCIVSSRLSLGKVLILWHELLLIVSTVQPPIPRPEKELL